MLKLYKGVFAAYMITALVGVIAMCVVLQEKGTAAAILLILLAFAWLFSALWFLQR